MTFQHFPHTNAWGCKFDLAIKSKFSLENVAKEFKYTKEMMYFCRKSTFKCYWSEMELDKTAQEENINDVISKIDSECVAFFSFGSALGNPGPTGSEAVIYYQGLKQEPICLSKPVCSNGNNYIGELVGIQIAIHHISEQEVLMDIHFFIDCQPAIVSAFSSDIPRNKVGIILQI